MGDNPLLKKLGVRAGQRMLIVHAPADYIRVLGTLPKGAEVRTSADGLFDFVQLFVQSKSDIAAHAVGVISVLKPGGVLWFSYPKKSSGVETDITRDIGWEEVGSMGWRPVSQVAIDDTWSALRFRPIAEVKSKPRS